MCLYDALSNTYQYHLLLVIEISLNKRILFILFYMVEAENELPYCLSLLNCPAVVCYLFLYSFIWPTTAFTWLTKVWTYNSLVFFTHHRTPPGAGFILEMGPTIFKLFKNTICISVCTLKCTKKSLIRFTPFIFSLNLSLIQNLKEALNMSSGMYSIKHLLEIMRL